METLTQIRQAVIADVEGGVYTDETKFEDSMVDMFIHECRAELIKKEQVINDMWVQSYTPVFSDYFQEGDYCKIKIEIPVPIVFKNQGTGIIYLGGIDGKSPFRAQSYGVASHTAYQHPSTRPSKRKKSYTLTAANTDFLYAEIEGDPDIENILVKQVCFNPTKVPNFRSDTDFYPISGELMIELKTNVLKKLMQYMAQTPTDTLGNTSDALNDAYRALNKIKTQR